MVFPSSMSSRRREVPAKHIQKTCGPPTRLHHLQRCARFPMDGMSNSDWADGIVTSCRIMETTQTTRKTTPDNLSSDIAEPHLCCPFLGSSRRCIGCAICRTGGGFRFVRRVPLRTSIIILCTFDDSHSEARNVKHYVDGNHDYHIPGKLAHDLILPCCLRKANPANK